MNSEIKVLVLGFTPFEKTAFESFFKLFARRETVYKIVPDAAQAQVLLVNGDNGTAVQWAAASIVPLQKALFIGAADPGGKWPTLPRPIKLTAVLGLLDLLVMAGKATPAPHHTAPRTAVEAALAASAALGKGTDAADVASLAAVRRSSSGMARSSFAPSNFLGLGTAPPAAFHAQQFDDILVVDNSDTTLKFMQNRLARYGFRAEMAKSAAEALARLDADRYKFVFLEMMTTGLDGYNTCRAIKQRKYASGRAPIVVMLASRGGNIDKIRGGLVGCDAYLIHPPNEAELLKVLSKYDEQVERSFQDTNVGLSGHSTKR